MTNEIAADTPFSKNMCCVDGYIRYAGERRQWQSIEAIRRKEHPEEIGPFAC